MFPDIDGITSKLNRIYTSIFSVFEATSILPLLEV